VLLRPMLIAVAIPDLLPHPPGGAPVGREAGLSLLWYPAVGLLLGLLLWVAAMLLSPLATPLAAALVLAAWVSCTGALHLDGLADTADGWVGGHGDRERTLAIMKDPCSGPVAVAAVVCLLLVKFAALSALREARGAASWSDVHFACGCICRRYWRVPLCRCCSRTLLMYAPRELQSILAQYQSRVGGRLAATTHGSGLS